jgi:hypothetical protein
MIGKKINQLATELAPVSTDLTIIGDPDSGVSKKITLAQLGAIFSGAVSFYTDLASFPATGDINVIYCAKDTQKLYLWSGSAYTEVFPSQALLDTYQLRSEKGNANGYASLDSGGKVPISQLPSSIMEYKGTWNASTNTPTLANGTGDTGDVYICNVAGTVNFGAGAITFAVGDYVIYSGSIWQRSSGAVGTVTSVALTVGGDAISVSGSPLTTSGTLALAFSGTSAQYINGAGNLINFPTSLVTGTGTINYITKWSGTSGELINGTLLDIGGTVYNSYANAGQFAWQFNGNTTTGQSYGALIVAGTNASDIALRIQNASSTSVYFYVWGDGKVQINNIPNATTDTDRFLVSDSGVIKYRTGAELLSDIGGASATGYVPYTGATANLDLGTHTLIAAKGTFSSSGSGDTVGITHSSGSGIALNITKGGNGEGLYINKTSGSGNAATIIGTLNATTLVKSGGTSAQFLKADGSVDSTSYGTGSVTSVGLSSATSGVTIGSTPITTSGTITLAIATASGSQQGLLSSTDWTTFNNKQNALTNPVTGTGTTNYLPKFTGASTIGNSAITDDGTTVTLISRALSGTSATFSSLLTANSGTTNNTNAITIAAATTAKPHFGSGFGATFIQNNHYYNGSAYVYDDNTIGSSYITLSTSIAFGTGAANTEPSTKMTLTNSGNLGLGVSPSAWGGDFKAVQIGTSGGSIANDDWNGFTEILNNVYGSARNTYTRIQSLGATRYSQQFGTHAWYSVGAGSGGATVSFTQAMTLTANGELCVGRTSAYGAGFLVNVEGNIYASAAIVAGSSVTAGTTAFGANGGYVINYSGGSGSSRSWRLANDIEAFADFQIQQSTTQTGSTYATKFYISPTGNVGIATSSTGFNAAGLPLVVGSGSGNTGMTIFSGASSSGSIHFADAETTGAGSYAGFINYDHSANSMQFGTTGATPTEAMRITSGGTLLVGATSIPGAGSSTTGVSLGASGYITAQRAAATVGYFGRSNDGELFAFYNNTTQVGNISVAASSTSYNTSSDYRLKQDIKDFNGLDLVSKLKAYDYEWKSDKSRSYGVIAHELQSVINYAVTGVKDGKEMQGVDYSKIVPVLIKSIQELKQELDTLKNK